MLHSTDVSKSIHAETTQDAMHDMFQAQRTAFRRSPAFTINRRLESLKNLAGCSLRMENRSNKASPKILEIARLLKPRCSRSFRS